MLFVEMLTCLSLAIGNPGADMGPDFSQATLGKQRPLEARSMGRLRSQGEGWEERRVERPGHLMDDLGCLPF